MSARRERRAQEVKARMVNAGIELLANRELDAFSIEEICELADVAKKTFYNYFSNKEALFADLIQQLIFETNTDIFDRAEERHTSFADRVHYVMDENIALRRDYGETERRYFRAGIKEIAKNSERILGFYGFFEEYFQRWAEQGQASGELTRIVTPASMARFSAAGLLDINQSWMNNAAYPHLQRFKEYAVFLCELFASWDKEQERVAGCNIAEGVMLLVADPEKKQHLQAQIDRRKKLMGQ
jgi:AcrR family transcriptional regulator